MALGRSMRRSLHAPRGAVGSVYGWVTVNSSCSRWLCIPTLWKQDASRQEPGSHHRWDSASLPYGVYSMCARWVPGWRIVTWAGQRRKSERWVLGGLYPWNFVEPFLEWVPGDLRTFAKPRVWAMQSSFQPVLCVASAGKCGSPHSPSFNWTDQRKHIRSW